MCKSLGSVPITTREKRKEGKGEEGLEPEPLALTPAHFEPIQLIAAELFPDDPPASASRDEAVLKHKEVAGGGESWELHLGQCSRWGLSHVPCGLVGGKVPRWTLAGKKVTISVVSWGWGRGQKGGKSSSWACRAQRK